MSLRRSPVKQANRNAFFSSPSSQGVAIILFNSSMVRWTLLLSCWWKRSLEVSRVMGLRSMIPSRSAVFNAAVSTACVCSPVQLLIALSSLFSRLFFAVRRKLMKPRQKSKSTSSMDMLSRQAAYCFHLQMYNNCFVSRNKYATNIRNLWKFMFLQGNQKV